MFSSRVSLGNAICPRGCHVTALVLNSDWITKNPENPVAEMFSRRNAPLSLLVYFFEISWRLRCVNYPSKLVLSIDSSIGSILMMYLYTDPCFWLDITCARKTTNHRHCTNSLKSTFSEWNVLDRISGFSQLREKLNTWRQRWVYSGEN